MAYGVSATGFTVKPFAQIRSDISGRLKSSFGNNFGSDSDTSVEGIIVAAVASEISDAWLAQQGVWASRFPQMASGVSLDSIGLYTGAVRLPATQSTVTLTITGTNGTIVPAGFTAQIPGTTVRFATLAAGTIVGGTLAAPAQCTVFGPVAAPAGTLTQIFTATAGVTAVTNAADAVLGRNLETDADFRTRRLALLRSTGDATAAAILADVINTAGVTEAVVLNNASDTTDANGVPPHRFEVIVLGGADQDIVNTIGKSEPVGIQSYGTSSGTYTDSQGVNYTISFTRPTAIPIYVTANLAKNLSTYPANGATLVKNQIIANWAAQTPKIARSVITESLKPGIVQVGSSGIPGVTDITSFFIGTAPSPSSSANITIGIRQYATFDSTRINVP